MYSAFCERCAALISERARDIRLDDFAVALLQHLFGAPWLDRREIRLPANHRDPALDETLAKWLAVSRDETDEVELRYSGLWTVLRASSFQNSGDPANRANAEEVSCSLLNIRPRNVIGGTLCDFRWYSLGKDRERDERRVFEGFLIPNVDRIEFLGQLQPATSCSPSWSGASRPTPSCMITQGGKRDLSVANQLGPPRGRAGAGLVRGKQ